MKILNTIILKLYLWHTCNKINNNKILSNLKLGLRKFNITDHIITCKKEHVYTCIYTHYKHAE